MGLSLASYEIPSKMFQYPFYHDLDYPSADEDLPQTARETPPCLNRVALFFPLIPVTFSACVLRASLGRFRGNVGRTTSVKYVHVDFMDLLVVGGAGGQDMKRSWISVTNPSLTYAEYCAVMET